MNSRLITPESPLLVPPLLAAEIGLHEAVILQQIHYLCQISKHIKEDGRRWFWKTLNDWGETLPFLKLSAIRRAIANLKDIFKLIEVKRHSEKTWYQANWFTINVENVEALWNRICQNQQIDAEDLNISMRSHQADDIKDFSHKDFSTQQHTDVAEKKEAMEEEPDWESIAAATSTWEQNQTSRSVEGEEEVFSSDEIDPHNDLSSAPEIKPTSTQNKPTKDEIRETCTELKRLRINPDPCLGVIKKYWGNVAGAISRVKESLAEGWCDNPTGLFINSCKVGIKAKTAVTSDVSTWFEWARRRGIVLAMQGGKWAYLPDGSQAELEEMMRRYPMEKA
ncbi:hypothetical protein [uncultured Nostoc sp.]|uniref:hypothetical protein n=1 Tax=uncultured Nostoc sp. TaxID=340711 RepID=UPI0035CAA989